MNMIFEASAVKKSTSDWLKSIWQSGNTAFE